MKTRAEIQLALLSAPSRARTILPELVGFFSSGEQPTVARFLHTFAGTRFTMPGPELFQELERHTSVAVALGFNATPVVIAALCKEHKLSYGIIREIHEAAFDRPVPEAIPDSASRAARVQAAAALMGTVRGVDDVIAEIYGLTAREKVQARKAAP